MKEKTKLCFGGSISSPGRAAMGRALSPAMEGVVVAAWGWGYGSSGLVGGHMGLQPPPLPTNRDAHAPGMP